MDAQHEVILRLFARASDRIGSVYQLGVRLKISQDDVRQYLQGKAIPPDDVLLRAMDLILDDIPGIRASVAPEVWQSLGLPE